MRTLVKFEHDAKKGTLISKTLGKIAFLSREYRMPEQMYPHEYWVVDIVNEIVRDQGGCFWVKALRKLDKPTIPLIAGAFEISYIDDIALVIPKQPSDRWVFPSYQQDVCIQQYVSSVIVDIECAGAIDFTRRTVPSPRIHRM